MGDRKLETGYRVYTIQYTRYMRLETEGRRRETGDWGRETGDTENIQETGNKRQQKGDGREKTGRETGELITVRGRISQFLKDAFDNRKYKLAVAVTIKSAKWGKKYLSVF